MSMQVIVHGTIRADGTLELDEKVAMPAGRVQVTVQPVVQPTRDDAFWQTMEGIWAAQKASGLTPRTREQIDAALEASRDEWDEHQAALERIHEESEQMRQNSPGVKE